MSVVCCHCKARFDRYTPLICPICADRKFAIGGNCEEGCIIEIPHYRPKSNSFVERPRLINF